MKTRDWNDILNKCELIEIQSFKPNRENKLFGYTWNVYKNRPCTISQKKFQETLVTQSLTIVQWCRKSEIKGELKSHIQELSAYNKQGLG